MAYKTKYYNMRTAKLEWENNEPILCVTKTYDAKKKHIKAKRISLQCIKDAIVACDKYEDETGQRAPRLDEWLDLLAKFNSLKIF